VDDDEFPFLKDASVSSLMRLHHGVIDELRTREVVRTGNAPLGDYAEYLFSKALCWTLEPNSSSGHDAIAPDGTRYQIKARRVDGPNRGMRQLSIFRALPDAKFDWLAVALFDRNCDVLRAALVPHSVVLERASYVSHVNGWRLFADDRLFAAPEVVDVTDRLRSV
jgi:hypothetical protein